MRQRFTTPGEAAFQPESAFRTEIADASDDAVGAGAFVLARSDVYDDSSDVLVASADTLDFMRTIPARSVQLVVSSPPYNIGKTYEERLSIEDYVEWQTRVLAECVRILHPAGSLCWEVGNYVDAGEVIPLDFLFYGILKDKLGLKLRNRIIWSFEHGLHARKRFSGRYETLLWFTKSDAYTFNLDPVRVPQKYPGKKHHKGPRKGTFSGNPLGKNPGDIWRLIADDWASEIWDIPNVKWNHPEKTEHPAQFPIELVERLVLALTDPGDTVFDPFMGAGSSLIASVLHERRAVGVDREPRYVSLTEARVRALLEGSLRRRPMGTAKYEPGRERIAQRPTQWDDGAGAAQSSPRLLERPESPYADRG